MFHITNVFFKDKVDGVCVPQFQIYYIRETTNPFRNDFLICVMMYTMCGGGEKRWYSRVGGFY